MADDELEKIEKQYGHLLVVAFCLALLLVVIILGISSHWFALRLQSDFWPVDKASVSPNILASVIIFDIVTLTAALFYPPFKKALDRGLSRHTVKMTSHVTVELGKLHEKIDAQHAERMEQAQAHHEEHMEQLRNLPTERSAPE
jgi:hypothetical protein